MEATSIGRAIRELRASRGWSQGQLAQFLNDASGTPTLTRNDISRWENGRRTPRHWLTELASVFEVDVRRLASASRIGDATVEHGGFVSAALSTGSDGTGSPEQGATAAIESFRRADRMLGGGHLYGAVTQYLRAEVAPRLVDADGNHKSVFSAAAGLTEMAGWMAHDAGRHAAAHRHFARALDLVGVGGDHQLHAHVLASASHLVRHGGKPKEAISLAQRGHAVLSFGPCNSGVEAQLLAMQARAFADLGNAEECARLLAQADNVIHRVQSEKSAWVGSFDEASLASEAAWSLLRLGDVRGAQRQAEIILHLRPTDRARSRAFGQLILATSLVVQRQLDEACAVAQQAIDATRHLGSYLLIGHLHRLCQLVRPHSSHPAVASLLIHIHDAVDRREWLTPAVQPA